MWASTCPLMNLALQIYKSFQNIQYVLKHTNRSIIVGILKDYFCQ